MSFLEFDYMTNSYLGFIGLPFGIWLAFSRGVGLAGVWIGLSTAILYAAAIGFYLCIKTDWEWEVQKVMKRLEDEEWLRKPMDGEIPNSSS
jgi:MATE family multidrug resistance protein